MTMHQKAWTTEFASETCYNWGTAENGKYDMFRNPKHLHAVSRQAHDPVYLQLNYRTLAPSRPCRLQTAPHAPRNISKWPFTTQSVSEQQTRPVSASSDYWADTSPDYWYQPNTTPYRSIVQGDRRKTERLVEPFPSARPLHRAVDCNGNEI